MKSSKKLFPGSPGTKQLVKKYGNKLYCVRYRYDEAAKKRIKTAEIIVDEKEWVKNSNRISPNKRVKIKISYSEKDIRNKIKLMGGTWDAVNRVWRLDYKAVKALRLEKRIVN